MTQTITRLNPATLPDAGAIGYSQICVAEATRLAFVSGQVAQTAGSDHIPDTLAEQTEVVIANLRAALTALGAGVEDIVQMRIYATDLTPERQAIAMSPLLAFLAGAQPALTGIGVSMLADPTLQIEVELVVRVD